MRAANRYTLTADAADQIAVAVMVDLRDAVASLAQLWLSGCSHLVGVMLDGSGMPSRSRQIICIN